MMLIALPFFLRLLWRLLNGLLKWRGWCAFFMLLWVRLVRLAKVVCVALMLVVLPKKGAPCGRSSFLDLTTNKIGAT